MDYDDLKRLIETEAKQAPVAGLLAKTFELLIELDERVCHLEQTIAPRAGDLTQTITAVGDLSTALRGNSLPAPDAPLTSVVGESHGEA